MGHTLRLYNTLSNDLKDPLTLADNPSSQISTHLLPFPNYRVPRDETLEQHFGVWLKKRSLSPVRGQTDANCLESKLFEVKPSNLGSDEPKAFLSYSKCILKSCESENVSSWQGFLCKYPRTPTWNVWLQGSEERTRKVNRR